MTADRTTTNVMGVILRNLLRENFGFFDIV